MRSKIYGRGSTKRRKQIGRRRRTYRDASQQRASSSKAASSSTSVGTDTGSSSIADTHTSTFTSSERMPNMTVSMRKPSEAVAAFPIRDAEDLAKALAEIGDLLAAQPGSADEARLEVLSVLVRDYEAKHYPMPPPDPVEAIKFRLEQQGLTTKALEGVIGSRTRVFEVLNRKRPLSLRMIRNLHERFGIPYESLLGTGEQPPRAPSQRKKERKRA